MLFDMQKYKYLSDKTQMLKKFPSDKINVTKNALFFFRELQLITVILSIRNSYRYELKHKFHLSKTVCGIFDFRFRLVFVEVYICSTKSMDSLTLKSFNSFQKKNNRKATHSFASRLLIFKLQQDVLKFNCICVSWSSPKTGMETNFSNLFTFE